MKHFSSQSIVSEYVHKSAQITKFALCDIFMNTWTNILTLRHEKQISRLHWLHLKQIFKEHAQITLLHQKQYLERILLHLKQIFREYAKNNFASPKAIPRTPLLYLKHWKQRKCIWATKSKIFTVPRSSNFASPKAITRTRLLHLKLCLKFICVTKSHTLHHACILIRTCKRNWIIVLHGK